MYISKGTQMKNCPICNEGIPANSIICTSCLSEIRSNEPVRKESVLYAWGRGLMIFLALFFFFRGMFALIDPTSYQKTGESMGFVSPSQAIHHVNAALLLLIGLMYAITWIGSFLEKRWNRPLCLVTLICFIAGQLFIQFSEADSAETIARGLALILFWITIPVIQYITYCMGKPHKASEEESQ
jgi:fucose 4-O-acetylase-like acetyltransferase